MLRHLLSFERRLLLRNGVFWIVMLVFALLGFGSMASDNVSFGGGVGNIMRNAPAVVIVLLGSFSVLAVLLTTIFVAGIALRDFEQRTAELFFATPLRKRDYLLGRFGGGFFASLAIMLATALGLWIGSLMPWLDQARLGPTPWSAYAWAFAVLVIPNLLFLSALLFLLATLTRSMLYSYIGVIAFFVLWTVSGFLTQDLDSRWIGALLDPSGTTAVGEHIRYWSSAQYNQQLPALTGLLLVNRALWLGVAIVLLLAAFRLFRADREGIVLRRRRKADDAPAEAAPLPGVAAGTATLALPATTLRQGAAARWTQYRQLAAFDLRGALTSAPFLVMLVLGLLMIFTVLKFGASMYGTELYPVTRRMLSAIDGGMALFLVIIVTFYAGELVWRERSLRVAEATDAYALPDWIPLASKMTALAGLAVVLLLAGALFTTGWQLAHGYTDLEPLLYLKGIALSVVPFVLMAALAVFLQAVSGNKFIGYLLMIVYLVARATMGMLDLDHLLYRYGSATPTPYSDMNHYGHFVGPHLLLRAYWAAFAAALLVVALLFWPRGTSLALRDRLRQARARLRGPALATLAASLLVFAGLGGWIFYNTNVLNEYVPGDLAKERSAQYEKDYRQYKDLPQPRIASIRADVDIFPERRSVDIRGHYRLENRTDAPISELHVVINPDADVRRLEFGPHTVVKTDEVHGYTIYRLATPLAPGAAMDFEFELSGQPHGFPMGGGSTAVVYNGTFFNNYAALPQFGYDERRQLQDRNDRRKHDLPQLPRMNPIGDVAARGSNYLTSTGDWVDFETTVSTSGGQIALAPGYLQREWEQDGRRYYHYKSEARLLPFFSWLSADWQVARDRWNDVAIEVYHHPTHAWNVPRMIDSTKKSLDYFSRNFSPYQFRQFRILEFPGYQQFAQAFAGTIPYSEAIGFIADLRDEEDIDYVFYVTAHEAAHQWWAHQLIGANVQGATMLSESLAQYSALMVMEEEYGPRQMRRFLKYELDRYLMSRATERVEEQPLALNENQQYIHYNKGSVVFYALRDAIGEDRLNAVLSEFVQEWGFKGPPYPTTRDFLDLLYARTDAEHHPFIRDLFERIVFWNHRVTTAEVRKRDDGKYAVTLKVHAEKVSTDGKGKETEEPIDVSVDIGVFARPPGGKEADEKVLYLRKHRITEADTTLELVVDELPYEAGIDPYNKLIDRDSGDNRKKTVLL
ncbi:ABC transporter permease/M1 family aminopeptidase [Pseudoxanthomonas suwonensis]|uniref:Membrane protein n=1 Tax=Pseudoxanthomonas suwonensis TaxID=314722 RepID=A0A0E3Z3T1_9GAMM|nr:M1 family aminopeptidase [Pseudoxanthomonas suwonensis]AKC87709.1 membrane protein [Pseudoxanthomonas suwonensis]